jgi:hypothetical protein
MTSDGFDHAGSLKRAAPSIPRHDRIVLTGPVAGLRR